MKLTIPASFELYDGRYKVLLVPRRGGKYAVRCIGYRSPLFVNGRFLAYDWTNMSYFVYESIQFKEAWEVFVKEVNYLCMIKGVDSDNRFSNKFDLEKK